MGYVSRSSSCGHGFTLLELLIAIAIFASVVSMAYGAYNLTFKVINNSSYHATYALSARIALDRLTEDLESFHSGSSGFLKGENTTVGARRGDSLSFTSTAHLVFDKNELAAGFATISYSVEEDDETSLLKLYRLDDPFRPGGTTDPADKGFLLCEGLEEVAVMYIDSNGSENDSWDSGQKSGSGTNPYPSMVKIKLTFAAKETENGTISFSTGVAIPPVK